MPGLWFVLERFFELLALWTLAVHGAMWLGLPAWSAWPALLLGACVVAWRSRGALAAARDAPRDERTFAWQVLAGGAFASLPALAWSVPSGDDFNFFHRALWQLDHLGEPFARGDTAFGVPGLDAISPLHALTTWELGIAMGAQALGLDALGAYHNGAVVLGHLLLATVAALWLRELGFAARPALVGVAALFAFLWLDDPSIRSWAIAYRMLWVGKMVQWLVVLPAALLFAWRYLRAPSPRRLLHPAACGVAAVATSGTGVFLLPGVFAAASLAGLALGAAGGLPTARRVLACAALNVASLYCFVVAALVFSGALPRPDDMRAWTEGFPSHWLSNLGLVVPHAPAVLRHALLAVGAPALLLTGDGRRFLLGFAAALVVIFLNPLAGPLWLEAAQPGSYWRVMLLLPVPLGFAVAAAAVASGGPGRRRAAVFAVAALVCVFAVRLSRPGEGAFMQHRYAWKRPLEVRLPQPELGFVRAVESELAGRRLLAAQGVSVPASLLVPGLRIEAARLQDTRHVFSNAGDPNEGVRRLRAWEWASRCDGAVGERAARRSIELGVDAVILTDCGSSDPRVRVLAHGGARFVEVLRADGYVLYLRDGR